MRARTGPRRRARQRDDVQPAGGRHRGARPRRQRGLRSGRERRPVRALHADAAQRRRRRADDRRSVPRSGRGGQRCRRRQRRGDGAGRRIRGTARHAGRLPAATLCRAERAPAARHAVRHHAVRSVRAAGARRHVHRRPMLSAGGSPPTRGGIRHPSLGQSGQVVHARPASRGIVHAAARLRRERARCGELPRTLRRNAARLRGRRQRHAVAVPLPARRPQVHPRQPRHGQARSARPSPTAGSPR